MPAVPPDAAARPRPPLHWPEVLGRLVAREDLDEGTAQTAMGEIMAGEVSPALLAAFLTGLRMKGVTAQELTGLVRAMRAVALPVPTADDPSRPLVDTCGTGGDRSGTFNISTLAALVAAACGARVAKHGNRAASGRCGSADLLEAWGVVIDLPPAGVGACVDQVGLGFCFAPTFHPAMRYAVPTRRELGIPTVFNFLGPLTNPAGAYRQTIGVSDPEMAPRMAQVLARLGAPHALVFHGSDGLDELTTTGPSQLWEVREGQVHTWALDPADLGVPTARPEDLRGGDVAENRRIADEVLDGRPGPARDVVVLGAAAALVVGDLVPGWGHGLDAAGKALDTGAVAGVLADLVRVSREQAVPTPEPPVPR